MRSLVITILFALVCPVVADASWRVGPRLVEKTVTKQVTVQKTVAAPRAVARPVVVLRQGSCQMINGRLVCPSSTQTVYPVRRFLRIR